MSFKHSLSALVLAACAVGLSLSAQTPAKPETAASVAFCDAVVPAPKKVAGPVFKLSHDYPQWIPDDCPECTWLKISVPLDKHPNFPPRNGQLSEVVCRTLGRVSPGHP